MQPPCSLLVCRYSLENTKALIFTHTSSHTDQTALHYPPPAALSNKAEHSAATQADVTGIGSVLFLKQPGKRAAQWPHCVCVCVCVSWTGACESVTRQVEEKYRYACVSRLVWQFSFNANSDLSVKCGVSSECYSHAQHILQLMFE